jgi:hypothetical protein
MLESITNLWRTPAPRELIARELEEARRSKLEAETARDFAIAMVEYNDSRISRLQDYETQSITDKSSHIVRRPSFD